MRVPEVSIILVQPEFGAEVNPLHVFVGRQFARGATPKNRAIVDDVGTVGNLQGLTYVVIGHEHPNPPVLEMYHNLLDVGDRDGVDARKRLVKKHETGLVDKRPGDLHAPPLAADEDVRGIYLGTDFRLD